jgi:hypothetical protein
MASKHFINYLVASTTFGAAYKTYFIWDAEVETYNYNNNKERVRRPLFLGEKICAFSLGMLYSPLLAPWWALNCVDRIDISLRGKVPHDFGYDTERKSFTDYVFM